MSSFVEPAPSGGLEPRLTRTGEELHGSLVELIEAIPNVPRRPQELARALGLKKDLTSRLLRATAQGDPIAAMHAMPGPEALRRLLEAAEPRLEDEAVLERARAAVSAYDRLIRSVAGDRGRFDTLLTGWLPEAREKVDLLCRQSVYRGMVGLRGSSGDVKLSVAIMHPSEDAQHVDLLWLIGVMGLQRLRPGVRVRFASRHLNAPAAAGAVDSEGQAGNDSGLDLDRFTPEPRGRMGVQRVGSAVHFLLDEPAVGNDAAVNVMVSTLTRRCMNRYEANPASPRRRGPVAEIDLPLKELVFDALVHRDLFPDREPRADVYDTAFLGLPSVNDPTRATDRLDVRPTVQRLADDPGRLRLAEHPSYEALIRHACGRVGWDPAEFRVYRARMEYPLYGTSVHLTFEAPADPKTPAPQVAGRP